MIDPNPARTAAALAERIEPLLRGYGPEITSAVLADLTAIYLAGFQASDRDELEKAREHFLASFITLVRQRIPINEQRLIDRLPVEGHG